MCFFFPVHLPYMARWLPTLLCSKFGGRRRREKCLPDGYCKEPVGIRRGNIMNQDAVMLYALSTCGHCKDMKAFLGQCGSIMTALMWINWRRRKGKQVIEKLIQISRECAFPTLIVGDKVIVGFRKEEVKELLGIS
jgi:glutaredoxin-like protein NrdH